MQTACSSLIGFLVAFAFVWPAGAATLDEAQEQQLIRNVLAVKATKQSLPFERWTYTTAHFYANSCLNNGKETLRKKLVRYGFDEAQQDELEAEPLNAGSFRLDNDDQLTKACRLLAEKGVAPLCIEGNVLSDARTSAVTLPNEYAIISREAPTPLTPTLMCSISHSSITSANGITSIEAVYSQFYALTKDDVIKIEGQGIATSAWDPSDKSRMVLTSSMSGDTGNLVIYTLLQKRPFVWTLATIP